MFEIGRLCVKIAGRDAGLKCVVIDTINDSYVLIDGLTRRRKCNVKHLEPMKEVITIGKNASHDVIVSEFKKLGVEIKEKKQKKKTERQKKAKVKKEKSAEKPKKAKKTPKAEKTIEEKVVDKKEISK